MEDRGEKIITLAREMLRSDLVMEPEAPESKPSISFKMLCLATLLTALGSSAVTEWAGETRRPINRYERTELKALVFYIARLKGLTEEDIRRDVESKLDLPNLDDLTEYDFNVARHYLQNKAS